MIHSYIKNKLHLNYFSFDKFLIITTTKIGSSYFQVLAENIKAQIAVIDVNIENMNTINVNPNKFLYNNTSENVVDFIENEWKSLLKGTLNKNVYILYRNPFDRLVSAFIQDNLKDLENKLLNKNDEFSSLFHFCSSQFNDTTRSELKEITFSYYKKRKKLDDYYLSKLLEKTVHSYEKFVQNIIEYFLKNNKVFGLSWLDGHNTPYLILIKELLNTLDKNNALSSVSLFNIDEMDISGITNFEEISRDMVFKYSNKTETYTNIINQSNDSLVSFIRRIIKSNQSIMLDVVDSLTHEYLMYIMISNNKKFKHFGVEYNKDLRNKSIGNIS